MKTLRLHALLLCLILLGGSCKKNADTVTPAACGNISQLATAYSNAVKTYSTTPTKANCEAMKAAADTYITAAGSCPGAVQADITAARNSIKDVVCQ